MCLYGVPCTRSLQVPHQSERPTRRSGHLGHLDHKDEPPTAVISPAVLPALLLSLSCPVLILPPNKSEPPRFIRVRLPNHMRDSHGRTYRQTRHTHTHTFNPLRLFHGAAIITQAYNHPYGQPATRVLPPIHPSILGLKWRSSQATPRERTRPLDPIYPTISDRRKRPLPSSTTGGDKVQLGSTSQQSRRHTTLRLLAPAPCRAVQRRAVRHAVLFVPLTDRPARVAPCSTASHPAATAATAEERVRLHTVSRA